MRHLNSHSESSLIYNDLTPRIVIIGTRANKAIHPSQSPLYTEGDDENIDEAKVSGGETTINKPYL